VIYFIRTRLLTSIIISDKTRVQPFYFLNIKTTKRKQSPYTSLQLTTTYTATNIVDYVKVGTIV